MSAITPFEGDLLQAVDEHRCYPTEAIAAAVDRPGDVPEVGTALNLLHDLGLLYRWPCRNTATFWAVTESGRDALTVRRAVLAGRRPRVAA